MFNPYYSLYYSFDQQVQYVPNLLNHGSNHDNWYQSRSDPRERLEFVDDSTFLDGICSQLMAVSKQMEEMNRTITEMQQKLVESSSTILQAQKVFTQRGNHTVTESKGLPMTEEAKGKEQQVFDKMPLKEFNRITPLAKMESPKSFDGQVFEEMFVKKISTEFENKILANNDIQVSDKMLANGLNGCKSDDDRIDFVLGENENSTLIKDFNDTIGLITGHAPDIMMVMEAKDEIEEEKVRIHLGVGGKIYFHSNDGSIVRVLFDPGGFEVNQPKSFSFCFLNIEMDSQKLDKVTFGFVKSILVHKFVDGILEVTSGAVVTRNSSNGLDDNWSRELIRVIDAFELQLVARNDVMMDHMIFQKKFIYEPFKDLFQPQIGLLTQSLLTNHCLKSNRKLGGNKIQIICEFRHFDNKSRAEFTRMQMNQPRLGISSYVAVTERAIKRLHSYYFALSLWFNSQDVCAVESKFIAEFLIKKQMNGVCCNGAKISAYSIFETVVFVPFDPGGIKFTEWRPLNHRWNVESYTTKSVSSQKKAFECYKRTDCTSFIESRTSLACGEKFWFTERTYCVSVGHRCTTFLEKVLSLNILGLPYKILLFYILQVLWLNCRNSGAMEIKVVADLLIKKQKEVHKRDKISSYSCTITERRSSLVYQLQIESYSEKLEVFTLVSDAGRYCMNMNGAHSLGCAKVCSKAYCLEFAFVNVLIQDTNGNTPLMIALSKRNQKGSALWFSE